MTLHELISSPAVARGPAARGRERPRHDRKTVVRVVLDASLLGLAVVLALVSWSDAGSISPLALAAFCALAMVGLAAFGAYRPRLELSTWAEVKAVAAATALAAMAVLLLWTVAGTTPSSEEVTRIWVYSFFYLAAARIGLLLAEARARRLGRTAVPTLIIGAGRVGRLTAARLIARPDLGLQPVGFLDKEPAALDGTPLPVPVLGASWDLEATVERHRVGHVVIAFSTASHEVLLRLISRCAELGVAVSLVPRLFERMPTRTSVTHVGGLPLIRLDQADPHGPSFALKYALDRAFAAILLVLLLPLLAAIAMAVRVTLGRPILFRQRRVGRDERVFEMLKFRTMREAPDVRELVEFPPDVAPGGIEGIDRRTRLGGFLRRTSLDELPQIINVLRGEMSLVGPRPERPEYVDRFEQSVYRYSDRHRVKAGITGWAQIHGLRGNTSLADRVEWDNYYIENWSLSLDLRILLRTIPNLFPIGRSREAGIPASGAGETAAVSVPRRPRG